MANEAVFEGVDPRFPLRTPDSVMHPGGSKYGQGLRGLTSIDNGLDNSGGGSDGASSAPVTP
jgi:hypothetical protein